jgi:HTH-type transcriptional regulator/antitoxin HigA
MGFSEKQIDELIRGKIALTEETAVRLSAVLGLPVPYWMALEAAYREDILKAST